MTERKDTGFTDKSDRPILAGDIISFRYDYSGGMYEPDEPHNDFGLVSWGGPKQGALVDCDGFPSNREGGSWFMPLLIEEHGELEIVASPGDEDYEHFLSHRKETP